MVSSTGLLRLWFLVFAMAIPAEPHKILFLMPIGYKSHKNFFDGVVRSLARADHQVTMVSGLNRQLEEPNVKTIILRKEKTDFFVGDPFNKSIADIIKSFLSIGADVCINALTDPKVEEVLKEEYDLVMMSTMMTECFLPTLYAKKVPYVYASPLLVMSGYSSMMGNLEYPSIVPNLISASSYPLSFFDRLIGTLFGTFTDLFVSYVFNPRVESGCKRSGLWPDGTPSLSKLQRGASLVICNSVKQLEIPARPFAPSIIFAGGVHIEPPKTLPKDLEEWVQSSGDDGFILFSLGSVTKTEYMKEEHRRMFVKVFSELKQKVLWKWDEGEMEDISSNVKLSKWLPQTDLLAHPKIRLFITHGGLLSTLETTHYGVPIIGMAIFADQHSNLQRARDEGWALKLDWDNLTEDLLRENIQKALDDAKLKSMAVRRSKLMQDRAMTPAEEVVYWTEYVIRHDGAKHLYCPFAEMSWIKIYNIDVWFVVCATLLSILSLCGFSAVFCLRCFIRRCKSTLRKSAAKLPPKSRKEGKKTKKRE